MAVVRAGRWLLCAALLGGARLQAQDRPNDADIFNAPSAEAAKTPEAAPPARSAPAGLTDPLTIGGQLYLRGQAGALRNQQVEDYSFAVPSLIDLFLDARPNTRIRAFVLGRVAYDPMAPDAGRASPRIGTTASDSGTSGSASLSSLFGAQTNSAQALLDQAWLRFDMWQTLFVTAGRQHVRWGTARFWTPTDFLHLRRRNPLEVFDARTGTDMLKLHLPIESLSWNFYGYAVTTNQVGTPSLYSVAGAARAEFVLGSNELGLGAFMRRGYKPKFAADLSMALGVFDLYGEAAVVDAGEIDRVGFTPDAMLPEPVDAESLSMSEQVYARIRQSVDTYYPVYRDHGYKPQIVGGLSYTLQYNDTDTFTLGIEYFYNALGYSTAEVYPGLLFPRTQSLDNPASFFYLGRHYAGAYLLLPAPFALDLHTFSLSTLGNLSDRSFVTRLDYSLQVLTHLRFEAYVAVFYGRSNGEFRLGIETPNIDDVRLSRQPAAFNVGVAFRVAL